MQKNIKLLYYSDLVSAGYGSKVTIWRKVKAGQLPKPIDVGGRPAWVESVMLDWIESKIAEASA